MVVPAINRFPRGFINKKVMANMDALAIVVVALVVAFKIEVLLCFFNMFWSVGWVVVKYI